MKETYHYIFDPDSESKILESGQLKAVDELGSEKHRSGKTYKDELKRIFAPHPIPTGKYKNFGVYTTPLELEGDRFKIPLERLPKKSFLVYRVPETKEKVVLPVTPETLRASIELWNPDRVKLLDKILEKKRAEGKKAFRFAYLPQIISFDPIDVSEEMIERRQQKAAAFDPGLGPSKEFKEWVKTIPLDQPIPQTFRSGDKVYRVDKLWELAEKLPEEDFNIDPPDYSEMDEADYIVDPKLNKDRWERAQKADLSYPIILSPDKYIADGLHRIIKARHLGHKSIKAKRFKNYEQMEPAFIFEKESEFAPGIPSKDYRAELPSITEPEPWEYGVHHHKAKKAGEHFDLRLGDPKSGDAHSWALRHWPAPGEKVLAVQQPTHTIDYMDFKGEIGEGYGAGKVELRDRDTAEVVRADPKKIHFNVYKGKGPEEYSLIRTSPDQWLLFNRTISRQRVPGLPEDKPPYKEKSPDKVDFDNPNEILQAKIDGAHNLIVLPDTRLYPRFMSYRPGKRAETGVIEHTQKIPDYYNLKVPPSLKKTILRGEIFATTPAGTSLKASELGGLLNANVWKSRALQEGRKAKLRTVLFDVVQYRGKDVSQEPYAKKLEIMKKVVSELPYFELPRMAQTPDEKRKLFEDIRSGKVPETREGVVAWNLVEPAKPIKYKFRPEHDVYIRGFFDPTPGSKYDGNGVGGFYYSHTPDGPIVGRVGTGLSDELRRKMYEDPDKYVGSVAKVTALDIYPYMGEESSKGALRAPSFQEWHLDKNDPDFLKTATSIEEVLSYLIYDLLQ